MTTNIINENNQSATQTTASVSFINYLKKWLREMPVGVCREMLGVHEIRLLRLIENEEKRDDVPQEHIDDLKNIAKAMRECLVVTDRIINECGEDAPLGDNPDYDDDMAADMFLRSVGW